MGVPNAVPAGLKLELLQQSLCKWRCISFFDLPLLSSGAAQNHLANVVLCHQTAEQTSSQQVSSCLSMCDAHLRTASLLCHLLQRSTISISTVSTLSSAANWPALNTSCRKFTCEALTIYVTQAWDADLLAAREAAAVREAAHAADFSAARAAALAKQQALAERLSAASAKASKRGGTG